MGRLILCLVVLLGGVQCVLAGAFKLEMGMTKQQVESALSVVNYSPYIGVYSAYPASLEEIGGSFYEFFVSCKKIWVMK